MELEQELRKVEEIEYKNKSDPSTEYANTFVQRLPRYTVKPKGSKNWKTKKKYLEDRPIKAHLQGKYYVGVLSKWYPGWALLDFDNVSKEEPERIKEILRLDEKNSMKLSSESPDSYHLLFSPFCNNRPPTTRLLQIAFKQFALQNGIEVYPQAKRTIRLPFGYKQNCLDIEYRHLENWQEQFYWFQKLDNFNLSNIPNYQPELDLKIENPGQPNIFKEGEYLLRNGLQVKSSRNNAQFKMLYNLWRRNIPVSQAKIMVWHVIKNRHNGFSKDIITYPGQCKKEIIRQAGIIYNKYELACVYPDETHNIYGGYVTKKDIPDIVRISKANLPRMKFLSNLIKFCYPRKKRNLINIHSDKLIEWSQRNYLKYLEELIGSGIVKRGDKYSVDRFSKSIKIKWNFRDPNNAILDDSRAPNTFEDTIKLSYRPEEFRELLIKAGSERTTAINLTKRLFESVTNV